MSTQANTITQAIKDYYPTVAWAPVNKLIVPSYQRADRRDSYLAGTPDRTLKNIMEDPQALEFGPLLLNKRKNGTYAVIDGLGRWCGAEHHGMKQVPALVLNLDDESEEARVFTSQRNRLRLTPFDTFKASLEYGDPYSLAVEAAVTKAGFILQKQNSQQNVNVLMAVGSLEWIAQHQSPKTLEDVLLVIASVKEWHQDSNAKRDKFLRGLSTFFWKYGDGLDTNTTIATFNSVANGDVARKGVQMNGVTTPKALIERALERNAKGSVYVALAEVLRIRYNAYGPKTINPDKSKRKGDEPYIGLE